MTVKTAVVLAQFAVGLFLKAQQVFVDALNLPGQETERAFQLADAAFQIANLCFEVHGHEQDLIIKNTRRAD